MSVTNTNTSIKEIVDHETEYDSAQAQARQRRMEEFVAALPHVLNTRRRYSAFRPVVIPTSEILKGHGQVQVQGDQSQHGISTEDRNINAAILYDEDKWRGKMHKITSFFGPSTLSQITSPPTAKSPPTINTETTHPQPHPHAHPPHPENKVKVITDLEHFLQSKAKSKKNKKKDRGHSVVTVTLNNSL